MSRSQLPNSVRKFLRREKARIRREVLGRQEAEKKIEELVVKVFGQYTKNKGQVFVQN